MNRREFLKGFMKFSLVPLVSVIPLAQEKKEPVVIKCESYEMVYTEDPVIPASAYKMNRIITGSCTGILTHDLDTSKMIFFG